MMLTSLIHHLGHVTTRVLTCEGVSGQWEHWSSHGVQCPGLFVCHWCGGGEERVVWVSNTVSRNKGELIVRIIVKTIVTLSQYHVANDPKYQHIQMDM